MNEPESYCTFLVRGAICGVPVQRVREIVCDQSVTSVPLAHEAVSGLINLRGQILTVFDVGRWLRLPSRSNDPSNPLTPRFHLIADLGREMVSMWVDELGPVVTPTKHELEEIPANVDPEVAGRIIAAARLTEGLVLLLDLDRLKDIKGTVARPRKRDHGDEGGQQNLPVGHDENERGTT